MAKVYRSIRVVTIRSRARIFSATRDFGILIETYGAITITKTQVNENGRTGALLVNRDGIPGKKVILKDSSFNGNFEGGVRVDSVGAISLTNIDSSDNSLMGGSLSIGDTVVDVTSIYYSDFWWFTAAADSHLTISLGEIPILWLGSVFISL